ncbi:MAG TPA: long-chain fatty acid--CoA ligase, partial [Marinobacter sp.]|nr:long-chain fatty acid--CoA ligase [Marinobacter sp.]
KDVIKTGGEWLSSLDLENMISQHPSVAGAAVVGVPDEKWGERPHALVSLKPGTEATAEDIRKHLQSFVDAGEINKWAIPERIDFVDDIPKTSVGKVNKKLIRDQLQ